ncbi:G-D-S-L family lipolytic protein [Polaribacter batillariae]|uniref:G-D-S-L family lipolytic protein n=1 Tax=Polaribacter batillariae TaxID=2808900 RepID=A0ABX7SPZ6_9FLAO|nr:G-D-S-L family lipolytic protein [Polaribacter batillariae]QTD36292.1 G-D-S-L family lipolytic protein [Polaribacter batillariae]
MKNYKYIGLLLLSIGFASCDVNNDLDPILEEVKPQVNLDANDLDFSKYVAIGASFTAGFTDGALFIEGQKNSFPNILAAKFKAAGGGDFNQPLMGDNIGGFVLGSTVIQPPRLYFNGTGPARLQAVPTTNLTAPAEGSSFNNYGIPGAKSFHLTFAGYGTLNPYFGRMASSTGATVLGDAMAQQPTFFTLSEVGGNDVLSFATSGGTGIDQKNNLDVASYGSNDITSPVVFNQVFNGMVSALTAGGTKGVIATVPDISLLPFFTTVPYNAIPMDEATATAVNGAYAAYNGGIKQAFGALVAGGAMSQADADAEVAKRTISFAAGQNAVVIIDENLTDLGAINPAFAALKQLRQATSEDLLVLPSSSFIGTLADPNNPASVNGVGVALADQWVLTPEEQMAIKTATDAYNATITTVVNANENIALIDLNAILREAANGIKFDRYTMTTDLVTGGLVSLDGIHLTGRGYALMANKMLAAIDAKFGSNFTLATDGLAKADDYPTNYSPALR